MNQALYSVIEEPAIKVTVTISRKQMWENYIKFWKDYVWGNYHGVVSLKEIADVLLSKKSVLTIADDISRLFRQGYTTILMGDAMNVFNDPSKNILRQIIVQDLNDVTGAVECSVVIYHENIDF